MRYARAAWDAERASWRAVIQLNVIRSIISIVETLQAEMDGDVLEENIPDTPMTPKTGVPTFVSSNTPTTETAFHYDSLSSPGASPSVVSSFAIKRPSAITQPASPATISRTNAMAPLSSLLTAKHQLLKLRLGPLRRVETDLQKRLGAGALDEPDGAGAHLGELNIDTESSGIVRRQRSEFSVHRLHDALEKSSQPTSRQGSQRGHGNDETSMLGETSPGMVDEATEIIASCQEDMKALWADEAIRVILKKRKIRMEETAGL